MVEIMKITSKQKMCSVVIAGAFVLGSETGECLAQQPMLRPRQQQLMMLPIGHRPVLTLENSSLIFRKVEPPPMLKKHDNLTVVVSITNVMKSEGDTESKKKVSLKAVLTDWIKLDLRGPSLRPDGQSQGDPTIGGTYDSKSKAESDIETREKITFKMSVKVEEVLPNGILRIEGSRKIVINDEQWYLYLSGEVNRNAIDENNTVTDDRIAHLDISKKERGQVRDGVRRGWFSKFYDRFLPI